MLKNIAHFLGLDGNDKWNDSLNDGISLKNGSLYFSSNAFLIILLFFFSLSYILHYLYGTFPKNPRKYKQREYSEYSLQRFQNKIDRCYSSSLLGLDPDEPLNGSFCLTPTSTSMNSSTTHLGRTQSSCPWQITIFATNIFSY